jgi:hypothetical protein
MTKNWNTILIKSGGSRHSCLTPDIRGNKFNFTLFHTIEAVCLSYTAFILLTYIFFIQFLCLLSWKDFELFSKNSFWIYWNNNMIFSFYFVYVLYYISYFVILYCFCLFGIKATIMVYDLWMCCSTYFARILLWIFWLSYQLYWSVIFFFCHVLVWFLYQYNSGFRESAW